MTTIADPVVELDVDLDAQVPCDHPDCCDLPAEWLLRVRRSCHHGPSSATGCDAHAREADERGKTEPLNCSLCGLKITYLGMEKL